MSYQAEFEWDAEPLDEVEPVQQECTASETILQRIKKLLRLSQDQAATPAEAERAAALAFDLAERHHVDVAALNLDDQGEPLTGEHFKCGRADRFTRAICGIVVRFFHVEQCFSEASVLFVGRETDVQIAGYVFDFLRRAGRAAARDYDVAEKRQRRKVTTLKRNNFLAGFAWGVRAQLMESREHFQLTASQTGLVLREEKARQEKLSVLVPEMQQIKAKPLRKVQSAASRGFISGMETQIHRPLGGRDLLRLK
ncbi:MAG: DUF2786 domain-containing protein [Chthoniobacterales bacterium]